MPEVGLEPTRPCGQRILKTFASGSKKPEIFRVLTVLLGDYFTSGNLGQRQRTSRHRPKIVRWRQLWVRGHNCLGQSVRHSQPLPHYFFEMWVCPTMTYWWRWRFQTLHKRKGLWSCDTRGSQSLESKFNERSINQFFLCGDDYLH